MLWCSNMFSDWRCRVWYRTMLWQKNLSGKFSKYCLIFFHEIFAFLWVHFVAFFFAFIFTHVSNYITLCTWFIHSWFQNWEKVLRSFSTSFVVLPLTVLFQSLLKTHPVTAFNNNSRQFGCYEFLLVVPECSSSWLNDLWQNYE